MLDNADIDSMTHDELLALFTELSCRPRTTGEQRRLMALFSRLTADHETKGAQ